MQGGCGGKRRTGVHGRGEKGHKMCTKRVRELHVELWDMYADEDTTG